MQEERMKILQMVAEGKISADEAETLLRSLGSKQQQNQRTRQQRREHRHGPRVPRPPKPPKAPRMNQFTAEINNFTQGIERFVEGMVGDVVGGVTDAALAAATRLAESTFVVEVGRPGEPGIGPEVENFIVGDHVFYAGDITRSGSNSEFQLVDERQGIFEALGDRDIRPARFNHAGWVIVT